MNLRHLRTFVAVAEAGTISKAAERLRTAQPALSRQIIDLEQELGLKLFDRLGRRIALTRQGMELLRDCRDVLRRVGSLTERARLLRGGTVGTLTVAASPQIVEGVLSTFLEPFAESFPGVQVILVEAVGKDQLSLLERGEVDIGIGLLGSVIGDDRFALHPLPEVEVLAALHKRHELASLTMIKIEMLAPHRLLLLDPSYVFRTQFDTVCRLAGVVPNIAFESRSVHTLLALAEAGHGVAIIQSAAQIARYELRTARLFHKGKPVQVPMATIYDRRRHLPQFAMAFCERLSPHFASILVREPLKTPAGGATILAPKDRCKITLWLAAAGGTNSKRPLRSRHFAGPGTCKGGTVRVATTDTPGVKLIPATSNCASFASPAKQRAGEGNQHPAEAS